MTRIYVCRKCKKRFSAEEYNRNRFCPQCETYLTARFVSATNLPKRFAATTKTNALHDSDEQWLPSGYEVREEQAAFIEEATKAMQNHQIFVGSAPCGIGKSLASLLSLLPQLEENRLLISFRTRSQLHIFLKELRGLNKKVMAVSFYNKKDMCPLRQKRGGTYYDFLEECRRLKENCEQGIKPFCKFYWNLIMKKKQAEALALDCARKILSPHEASQRMARQGFCAYESLKRVLNRIQIFLGTYNYTFNPSVGKALLQSWGIDLSKVYLIVDEAHNIPDFARELLSDQITQNTIENALRETELFEHNKLAAVQDYLNVLSDDVFKYAKKSLGNANLRLLDPQDLADLFLEWSGSSYEKAAEILHKYGEHVKETRQIMGYDRIFSYAHRVGDFVENFFQKTGEKYVHLVQKDRGERVHLAVKSLDGREITDPILQQTCGSILMSGFLSPPDVYRDLIVSSQEGVFIKEFNSPFPEKNRLILAANDVTSQYEKRNDQMLKKWINYIEVASLTNHGNMAVFFTSYNMMNNVLSHLDLDRRIIVEERRTRRDEVLENLAQSNNNALFGVMGGKFSEGMDYPNNLLTSVLTVGLPYATWSDYQRALIYYYDYQFPGRGRVYAYLTPAIFRLVQACGRIHRSAKDKGCIIMLDDRVTQQQIRQLLPNYYQKEMTLVRNPLECGEYITKFWNRHKNS